MTVFKTFLKVLNKCKGPIIIYTVFLVFFGGFSIKTNETTMNFTETKPDVLIVNNDEYRGITKNFIDYIESKSNKIKIKNEEEAINDALFYRDVNYVIYIPTSFNDNLMNHKNPQIEVKSTGDYQSSLANIMVERYLNVANTYVKLYTSEDKVIDKIDETLKTESKIEVTSSLDTSSLDKATSYYNFTNYCLLAGTIYVICLVLSSFKEEKIKKRTIISSMDYKKINLELLLSNSLFAIFLWGIYVILSFIIVGEVMFSIHGLLYILNTLVFTLCALTISFLLGNTVKNKDAINGIVNVIALGSSFLCGSFVPMEMLPDVVLNIAHVLPSYWFIKSNEIIKGIEIFSFSSLQPILINMGVIILFSFIFIIVTIVISNKTRKID